MAGVEAPVYLRENFLELAPPWYLELLEEPNLRFIKDSFGGRPVFPGSTEAQQIAIQLIESQVQDAAFVAGVLSSHNDTGFQQLTAHQPDQYGDQALIGYQQRMVFDSIFQYFLARSFCLAPSLDTLANEGIDRILHGNTTVRYGEVTMADMIVHFAHWWGIRVDQLPIFPDLRNRNDIWVFARAGKNALYRSKAILESQKDKLDMSPAIRTIDRLLWETEQFDAAQKTQNIQIRRPFAPELMQIFTLPSRVNGTFIENNFGENSPNFSPKKGAGILQFAHELLFSLPRGGMLALYPEGKYADFSLITDPELLDRHRVLLAAENLSTIMKGVKLRTYNDRWVLSF